MLTNVLEGLRDRLATAERIDMDIPGFRRAAVLVPLLDAATGLELLFTVRASSLARHAGQIAFPGGGMEPGESAVAAALRETEEEVGLRVRPEAVLGPLSDHPSPAGYVATPWVARVPWPQPLRLNAHEVADTFTVPLAELAAIHPESEVRQLLDYRRRIFAYQWRGRRIWGFTGNIVKNLLDVLEGRSGDPFEPW
ncbi:MAG: CoA pyrophosphatase [Deinococcales bacterium]